MSIVNKIEMSGIIPVLIEEKPEAAVVCAKAMLCGGIDTMEIVYRDSSEVIKMISKEVPEMSIGVGVMTLAECKDAVDAGAAFILTLGFDEEIVSWCCDHQVEIIPGCVTPTELMMAKKHGLETVLFCPANLYGGLDGVKQLAGFFRGIKFIVGGGVDMLNIGEYGLAECVSAVSVNWICSKDKDANAIVKASMDARHAMLGYEVAHLGINCVDKDESLGVCKEFLDAFALPTKVGNSSNYASSFIEVMNTMYLGKNGHIAIRTNNIAMGIADLERKGFAVDMDTAKFKAGKMIAVYLKQEMGGFAVHLVQK